MKAKKETEDYTSQNWDRVLAYDSQVRGQFDSHDPDPWSSDDERTYHLFRLVASARKTGEKKYVDLLLDWYDDPRFTDWTRLQRTILVGLAQAVMTNSAGSPSFLLHGGGGEPESYKEPCWPGYTRCLAWPLERTHSRTKSSFEDRREGALSLWARTA